MDKLRWVYTFLILPPLRLFLAPLRWLSDLFFPHACDSRKLRDVRYSKIGWHDGPCPHTTGDRYYRDSIGELVHSAPYAEGGRLLRVLRPEGTIENFALDSTLEKQHVKAGDWRRLV